MRVLVAGATGLTGRRLVHTLVERGHEPVAMVRGSSDVSVLPAAVERRTADLADLPDDVCDGVDAVVFAAGSGSGTGPEMTDAIDRDGAIALVDRAERSGVDRFVMLSSVGAADPDPDHPLGHYLQAKHDADEHLMASSLTWSILRPVALTKDDGTGDIRLGDRVDPKGEAARGDVATVLADALVGSQFVGQALRMESVGR